jgi:hypothetical protein
MDYYAEINYDTVLEISLCVIPVRGMCHVITETVSHILCKCVALAELRFRRLGKYFMEPSDYNDISLCKILYFVRRTGLLAE